MPHVQTARKTLATCPPRCQGRCHNFGIGKTNQKMDRIAEIVNYGKLSVNSAQRIRIDTLQCSAVCTYSTHRGAQVYMYIIIQKVRVHGCHIFCRPSLRIVFALDPNLKFWSFWPFSLWPQVHSESWRHATTLAFDFGHMSTYLWQ